MPIKLITADENGHPLAPTPKGLIKEMVEEYMNTMQKNSTDSLRKRFPGRTFPDGSPFCDTYSAWVSKVEIEQLLKDNDGDGIRFYFGCHKRSTMADVKVEYQGMHNIILVATKNLWAEDKGYLSVDQLKESKDPKEANSIITSGLSGNYSGNGGDLMPLCPPQCPRNPL